MNRWLNVNFHSSVHSYIQLARPTVRGLINNFNYLKRIKSRFGTRNQRRQLLLSGDDRTRPMRPERIESRSLVPLRILKSRYTTKQTNNSCHSDARTRLGSVTERASAVLVRRRAREPLRAVKAARFNDFASVADSPGSPRHAQVKRQLKQDFELEAATATRENHGLLKSKIRRSRNEGLWKSADIAAAASCESVIPHEPFEEEPPCCTLPPIGGGVITVHNEGVAQRMCGTQPQGPQIGEHRKRHQYKDRKIIHKSHQQQPLQRQPTRPPAEHKRPFPPHAQLHRHYRKSDSSGSHSLRRHSWGGDQDVSQLGETEHPSKKAVQDRQVVRKENRHHGMNIVPPPMGPKEYDKPQCHSRQQKQQIKQHHQQQQSCYVMDAVTMLEMAQRQNEERNQSPFRGPRILVGRWSLATESDGNQFLNFQSL